MADPINLTPYTQEAGIPGQWSQDITVSQPGLIAGDSPDILITDEIVTSGQNLAALTPVMVSAGKLVVAVSGTVAVGITVAAVNAAGGDKGAPIYRGGCFNIDAINWPASYDTLAKKQAAFAGAPSPTQITLRAPKTYTV